MKIFAIGDLHLSNAVDKPMDIFGPGWENHFERIQADWRHRVTEDDLVLIPGDISWGMKPAEARPDLDEIGKLPGKIIYTRGNHDYWWQSITAVREMLGEGRYALQNDAVRIQNAVICGTRGWAVPEVAGNFKDADDEKIYKREVIRLELALKNMQKLRKAGDKAIVMLHYPPFNVMLQPSDFTRLCEAYKVDYVVYGHLHGKNCRVKLHMVQNGIEYFLTSCDQVNCELVEICEV